MLGVLDPDQIETLLHREVIGRLGCVSEGRAYVVPITYAYDGRYVYGHSAEGMKLRSMRAHPRVCFEVDRLEDLARWESVIAWGVFEELRGEEAERGLRVLLDRLAGLPHGQTGAPPHPRAPGAPEAVVYRVELHEKSGRFERRGPGGPV